MGSQSRQQLSLEATQQHFNELYLTRHHAVRTLEQILTLTPAAHRGERGVVTSMAFAFVAILYQSIAIGVYVDTVGRERHKVRDWSLSNTVAGVVCLVCAMCVWRAHLGGAGPLWRGIAVFAGFLTLSHATLFVITAALIGSDYGYVHAIHELKSELSASEVVGVGLGLLAWWRCLYHSLVAGQREGLEGQILYVPDNFKTIKEALAAAEKGDRIQLAPGKYSEEGLILTSGIEIVGMGETRADVVIQAAGMCHVLGIDLEGRETPVLTQSRSLAYWLGRSKSKYNPRHEQEYNNNSHQEDQLENKSGFAGRLAAKLSQAQMQWSRSDAGHGAEEVELQALTSPRSILPIKSPHGWKEEAQKARPKPAPVEYSLEGPGTVRLRNLTLRHVAQEVLLGEAVGEEDREDTGLYRREFFAGLAVFSGHVRVVNCDIRSPAGWGVLAQGGRSSLQLSYSTVHGCLLSGVCVSQSGLARIQKCIVRENRRHGIVVQGRGRADVRGCVLLRNQRYGLCAMDHQSQLSLQDCDITSNELGPLFMDLEEGVAITVDLIGRHPGIANLHDVE